MNTDNRLHNPNKQTYVVAIDLGTQQIRVCCAIAMGEEFIQIIGCASVESTGLSVNGITSMDKLKENISSAYNKAYTSVRNSYTEKTLPSINSPRIMISVPGKYIKSKNNTGSCELNHQEVNDRHVDKARRDANSLIIDNYELINSFDNYFEVDGNSMMEDPRGTIGGQLKVNVHLIYAQQDFLHNIRNAVSFIESEYEPDFIFSGTASALALLTEEEKNNGVAVFDIGASTVDITVFNQGILVYSGASPYAGQMISYRLAVLNGIPQNLAENIKVNHGCVNKGLISNLQNTKIQINTTSLNQAKDIPLSSLAESLEGFYDEIMANSLACLKVLDTERDFSKEINLKSGFIVTGGCTKIVGIEECLSKYLSSQKIMSPIRLKPISKSYLTGYVDAIDEHSSAALIGLVKLCHILDGNQVQKTPNGFFPKMINKLISVLNIITD